MTNDKSYRFRAAAAAAALALLCLSTSELCSAPRFTADDERFMRLALQAADEGVRSGGFPFGAAIVRDGQVIVTAGNRVQHDADPTAHAEVQAIRDACKKLDSRDLSGTTIYATGEPCPMCFSACFWANIPRIVFGARIVDIEKAGVRQLKITTAQMKTSGKVAIEVRGDCLRDENLALLQRWSAQRKP